MHVTIDFGKVTDWLTAAGTIGAVWTALYLANRDNSVRVQVHATIGLMLGGSNPPTSAAAATRYVWINATNIGRRTAYLTNIGWRSGALRQGLPWIGYLHFAQLYRPGSGPQLPIKLEDGQAASWFLPLNEWMQDNAALMSNPPAWVHLRTTYLQVFTSAGAPLTVKINRSLSDKIISFVKGQRVSRGRPLK
jgi:hypothetical protein